MRRVKSCGNVWFNGLPSVCVLKGGEGDEGEKGAEAKRARGIWDGPEVVKVGTWNFWRREKKTDQNAGGGGGKSQKRYMAGSKHQPKVQGGKSTSWLTHAAEKTDEGEIGEEKKHIGGGTSWSKDVGLKYGIPKNETHKGEEREKLWKKEGRHEKTRVYVFGKT